MIFLWRKSSSDCRLFEERAGCGLEAGFKLVAVGSDREVLRDFLVSNNEEKAHRTTTVLMHACAGACSRTEQSRFQLGVRGQPFQ